MAQTRLYVGNIPFSATEQDIRRFFVEHPLTEVRFVTDRETGRSRGFCFVELDQMHPANDPERVIAELNDQELDGRRIVVNLANDKPRPAHHDGGKGRRDGRRERRDRY